MLMWVGVNKEPVNKGLKTLFVGSPKITFNELEKAIKDNPDIEHIYFGAGKCSKINSRVLTMFIKKYGVYTLTVEVPFSKMYCLTSYILKYVTLILTIDKQDLLMLKNMNVESINVRLQSLKGNKKFVIMTRGVKDVNVNELQGSIYNGDKVIL